MQAGMTEQEIKKEIQRLAPFHHDVELPYGLRTHIPELSRRGVERTRVSNLVKHLWPSLLQACGGSLRGLRVLDVACNCGGFSVEAAKNGADHVLGVDITEHYIEQANFIKRALGLEQLEFTKTAVEDLDSDANRFDVTFCFGILYHLENPLQVMKKLASMTNRVMAVDTELFPTFFTQRPLWLMNFMTPPNSQARDITTALWRTERVCQFRPNAKAVEDLLKYLGFSVVTKLSPWGKALEKRYYVGRRAAFLAVKR